MITDADKQDEMMELAERNHDRGNSQHSTSRLARIYCYVPTLRTELMANLNNNHTAGYSWVLQYQQAINLKCEIQGNLM